jgi:CheY-like chemotaxis protein
MKNELVGDILIYSSELQEARLIETLVHNKKLRAKTCFQYSTIREWLNTRNFSIAFVSSSIPANTISKLVEDLWSKDNTTRVVVYNTSTSSNLDNLLIGTELIEFDELELSVNEILDQLIERKYAATSPTHLMVVEDLDSPREIICLFLEGLGYDRITGVSSAKEAIQLLQEQPSKFTTVITDVKMPGMNGADLIRFIRRDIDLKRLPVIVLTAYGTADCLVDCLKAGATGFLVKPPKKPDLKRELQRAERVRKSGASVRLIKESKVQDLYNIIINKSEFS